MVSRMASVSCWLATSVILGVQLVQQGGMRSASRLFELSSRNVCHRKTAQCSRAISLVNRRQRTKTRLVQRDRLLRLAGRQPAARALDLDVARRAVGAVAASRVTCGIARRPGVRLVKQPL